mmetsp:Transcript_31726/g.49659  ORF Transcript_31726/g.49659 Transcript_31726/m.49659 type:complete len:232 (+) Transcript_31726:144-839(+)
MPLSRDLRELSVAMRTLYPVVHLRNILHLKGSDVDPFRFCFCDLLRVSNCSPELLRLCLPITALVLPTPNRSVIQPTLCLRGPSSGILSLFKLGFLDKLGILGSLVSLFTHVHRLPLSRKYLLANLSVLLNRLRVESSATNVALLQRSNILSRWCRGWGFANWPFLPRNCVSPKTLGSPSQRNLVPRNTHRPLFPSPQRSLVSVLRWLAPWPPGPLIPWILVLVLVLILTP